MFLFNSFCNLFIVQNPQIKTPILHDPVSAAEQMPNLSAELPADQHTNSQQQLQEETGLDAPPATGFTAEMPTQPLGVS